MRSVFLFPLAAAAALLAAASCITNFSVQAQQSQQDPAGSRPPEVRAFPAPTNLKVLPKDLTGQQVHDLMKQWKAALGISCNACHSEDRENLDADGRPLLKFADDSKPEKATARLMYTMTEEINLKYIAKIDDSSAPVTCGTCHRGHLDPKPFVIRNEDGPPPQASPPAEEMAPPQ
jgi:hypothetical protein